MKHKPSSYDYQKQNMDLTKAQFDIVNNGPNRSEPFVGAIDDFTKINQKKKGLLEAGVEGFASGLKYGAKSQEVDRKQKLFDWLESNIMAMREQSNYLGKQQMEREALEPIAAGAIRLAYSDADYDTVNNNARSMWDQAKMKGLVKGNFISLVPKTTVVNYQNDDGSFSVIDLSSYAPDTAKEAADMRYKNLSLGLQQQRADDYGRGVQSSIDLHNAQIAQMPKTLSVRQQEAKTAAENSNTKKANLIHKTVGEELDSKRDFLREAPRIKEVVKRNPAIFQSLSQIQWSNQDPTYFETVTRGIADKFRNPQDKEDIAFLTKAINKMKIDVSKGFARPNQFLEKTAAGAVPNFGVPPETFIKILNNMTEDAEYDAKKYESRIKAIDSEEGQLAKAWINSPQSQQTPQGNGGMVLMVDPNTGLQEPIPLNQVERAEQLGLKRVGN